MNPLKKIISMQKLSYGVGYIYIHWHYWFLTHFYQDNNIPYTISLKGDRTAYGLACDSAKVKAWYVAPNVTDCLRRSAPVERFAFEWARKVVQEDISNWNYVYLELLTLLECLCP